MLNPKEMVHDILEHAMHRSHGSRLPIPSFLPPQTKELLTELAMVEDEIAKLEGAVRNLENGASHEKKISKELSKSKEWQQGNLMKNIKFDLQSPQQNPKLTNNQWAYERMPFEAKALHFISKAIKGDDKLDELNVRERVGTISATRTDKKENSGNDQEIGLLHDKATSAKSGMQRLSLSPMRPLRNQTSKSAELVKHTSFNLPLKSLQKQSPSPIMKCLIFTFVRLMRTSRALELEKMSTVSRSTHSSFSSRSFRVETSSSNTSLQKESRQQDPYGIFDISIPRDIGPYKNLVRFTSSSLDHKSISSSSSVPLLQKLRVLMNNLQNVDLRFLTHQQKLAFWINMYNVCIMHVQDFFSMECLPTPEKLLILMNKATVTIGGNKINAPTIEQTILRQQSASSLKTGEESKKDATMYSTYGLEFPEPNVTFALCCGTRSSPSVKIFTAEGVTAELERSKLEYLQASMTDTKRLVIPELLLRNMADFAIDMESLVEWVCQQLPASGSLRKLMVDCIRDHNNGKIHIVENMPYDIEFQYLLSVTPEKDL
ncbi:hypothetical protein MKX03_004784 [Papaver bracteatum]|nr:hypothetical protein MKX03_004784 [Papaver bracteatum]